MTKRWLFTLIFLSYQFSQSKLGGVNQKTLDYYTYRETKFGVEVCQCSPFCLGMVSLFGMEHICRHSTLEQGFIILRLHYISPAIPAPFHAIYQSLVLPSFRSVMKQHCHVTLVTFPQQKELEHYL